MSTGKFYPLKRKFWRSQLGRLLSEMGSDAFMVWAYLVSSPRGNMVGIYEIPINTVAKDTNLNSAVTSAAIQNLAKAGVIKYDHVAEYVCIIGVAMDSLGENPSDKQIKGAVRVLEHLFVDECAPFAADLLDEILNVPLHRDKLGLPASQIIQAQNKFEQGSR